MEPSKAFSRSHRANQKRGRWASFLFLLPLFFYCVLPVKAEPQKSTFLEFESFSFSESASIKQILDNLEGDTIRSGRRSFTHNKFQIGMRYRRWSISAIARYDYYLKYHPDTAEIMYRDANDIQLTRNRDYIIDIEAVHASTRGLKVGYLFDSVDNFTVELRLSLLASDQLLDGFIRGQATVEGDEYFGSALINYVYDEPVFLDESRGSSHGWGYSTDIRIDWKPATNWQIYVAAQDLVSEIKYDNASFTVANIDTNRISFDSDGLIQTTPLISGERGGRSHTLRYPNQFEAKVSHRFSNGIRSALAWHQYDDLAFYSVANTLPVGDRLRIMASYEFISNTAGIGFRVNGLEFSLKSDNINFSKANSLILGLNAAFDL